jgi:hypothetical protein
MNQIEGQLKGLMIAALGGDERAYRDVLGRLSRYLRGYYKTRLPQGARSSAMTGARSAALAAFS